MEKVILTKEQAEKIEPWKHKEERRNTLLKLRADRTLHNSRCLYELSLDEVARALYIGYEVEPEYSAGDWVWIRQNELVQLTKFITHKDGDVNWEGVTWCNFRKNIHEIAIKHSEIKRHATPYEIAKEKERRLFASVGREPWVLKEGDILYDKQNGFSGVVDKVAAFEDGVTVIFKDKNWAFYNNVKEEYTVACFAENRLDVKTNE